jgi:hypothetical protein
VTIRCHSEGCVATVPVQTLASMAGEVEAALSSGRVPWRPYETWKGRERQKQPQKKG